MERGKFIVIEGPDNSGKSTQCRILTNHLNVNDVPAITLYEPGGTEAGEQIRAITSQRREKLLDPTIQLFLFTAARGLYFDEVSTHLDRGVSVISDRGELSTFIYQGYVQGVPLEKISQAHEMLPRRIQPNLTLIVDVSVEESFRRNGNVDRTNQQTIYEQQSFDFHSRVREGYLSIAQERNLPIIDGTQSIDQVHQEILSHVMPLFTPRE